MLSAECMQRAVCVSHAGVLDVQLHFGVHRILRDVYEATAYARGV